MQPTQLKHTLEPVDNSRFVGIIYADRIASRSNHRLYRQGRNYCLRLTLEPYQTGNYAVFALRNDWMVHNAWKYAYETYLNNSKEELAAMSDNNKARWGDFRVVPGITGTTTEIQHTQFDWSGQNWQRISSGEFINSQVVDESGNAFTFGWGSAASMYNILTEYEKKGNQDRSPTSPEASAGYQGLDNDLQDLQLAHLGTAGNNPPYNATDIDDGTPWTMVGTIGADASGVQSLTTGYFNAPCGLVIVTKTDNFALQDSATLGLALPTMSLEFKSGKYKGVHAPSMGTAKLVKNHYEVR